MISRAIKIVMCIVMICGFSGCTETREKQVHSSSANAVSQPLPEIQVVRIKEMQLNKTLEIPGELRAFQNVAIEAKVQGYISWIGVDRGSKVKIHQKMLTIFCPELEEHAKEEESKYSSAVSSLRKSEAALASTKSKLLEAKARLDADMLTLDRLQQTLSKMAGSVAQNDIDVQTKTVESDKARVESMSAEVTSSAAVIASDQSNVAAAMNVLKSVRSLRAYLTISAPFDGMVTERNVHVGSMVGPQTNKETPLLRIQEKGILRLVVAVPEDSVAGLKQGSRVSFCVPAFPGVNFKGIVTRPAYSIDVGTRTMPVEMDVDNSDARLQPGMFATIKWQVSRPSKTLFVPASAVATDLKGSFLNVIKSNVAQRIPVQKGQPMGDLIEVIGKINAGDLVALTASNELKDGTHLVVKRVSSETDGNN